MVMGTSKGGEKGLRPSLERPLQGAGQRKKGENMRGQALEGAAGLVTICKTARWEDRGEGFSAVASLGEALKKGRSCRLKGRVERSTK